MKFFLPSFILFLLSFTFASDLEENLAETKNESPSEISNEAKFCCICYDHLESDERLVKTPCQSPVSHYFHSDCLERWLKRELTCPICRAKVEREELQKYDPKQQKFKIMRTSMRCSALRRTIVRILTSSNQWTTAWLILEFAYFLYLSGMGGSNSTVATGYCLWMLSHFSRKKVTEFNLGRLLVALLSNVLFTLFFIYTVASQMFGNIKFGK